MTMSDFANTNGGWCSKWGVHPMVKYTTRLIHLHVTSQPDVRGCEMVNSAIEICSPRWGSFLLFHPTTHFLLFRRLCFHFTWKISCTVSLPLLIPVCEGKHNTLCVTVKWKKKKTLTSDAHTPIPVRVRQVYPRLRQAAFFHAGEIR